MNEIDSLKQDLLTCESSKIFEAAEKLSGLGVDAVSDYLLPLLDSRDPKLRNTAAIALGDLKDNRAVDPLFNAIFKKDNYHYNGTLVHALSYLNCEKKLLELFDILFFHEYEPRIAAVVILDEQEFEFSETDLKKIQTKWDFIKKHPEECPEFEKAKNDIENIVDGFLAYLNEEKTCP
jgi:hypothetical protein